MTAEEWQEQAAYDYSSVRRALDRGDYYLAIRRQRYAALSYKQARILMGIEE